MKLIVISSPTPVPDEHEIINSLFEEGMEIFHVYKPNLSKKEIDTYIEKFPAKYHPKIALHADFPKFHSLKEMQDHKGTYEYAFLSPVFDSISKPGYLSKFSHRSDAGVPGKIGLSQISPELIPAVRGKNIIALGGVDIEKIDQIRKIGFAGVAIAGAIWKSQDPLEKFKKIKDLCLQTHVLEE